MPNPRKQIAGKKFGRLTAICPAESDRHGNTQWLCACKCGSYPTVRYLHLSTGRVRSCGCLRKSKGSR